MDDRAASTLNLHLQQLVAEQKKQTQALDRIAAMIKELADAITLLPR